MVVLALAPEQQSLGAAMCGANRNIFGMHPLRYSYLSDESARSNWSNTYGFSPHKVVAPMSTYGTSCNISMGGMQNTQRTIPGFGLDPLWNDIKTQRTEASFPGSSGDLSERS